LFRQKGKQTDVQTGPAFMTARGVAIACAMAILCAFTPSGKTQSGDARGAQAPAAQAVDFEFFKTRVEPIFLKKRPTHARCYVCHSESATLFRLEKLAPGSTFWTEEQSLRNFQRVSQLVNSSDPMSSRLLMHPLAHDAGGDPYHAGGRQFASQDDPDWMTLAEWVRGGKEASAPSDK
jgi:hypothetical protein